MHLNIQQTHIYIHTHINTHTNAHTYTNIHTHTYTHTHTHNYIHIACIIISMYICYAAHSSHTDT